MRSITRFRHCFCLAVFVLVLAPAFDAGAQESKAEALLTRDLRAGTKTLSKNIVIYHYFNVPEVYAELTTTSGRHAFVNRYLEHATSRFWDLSYEADTYINAGPGIYLAIDPHISRSFGNTVLEMPIPKGELHLSVLRPIAILPETIQALKAEGVLKDWQLGKLFVKAATSKTGFYRDTLKNMTQSQHEAFRKLVQKIFRAMGIRVIEYNWNTSLFVFCRKHNFSSFVFIGAQNPANESTSIVDGPFRNLTMVSSLAFPNLNPAESEAAERIAKFRDVLGQIVAIREKKQAVPKDFVRRFYADGELASLRNTVYSCEM